MTRLFLIILLNAIFVSGVAETKIDDILSLGLSAFKRNDLKITVLKGGLSGTSLYKVETPEKSYVLRLNQEAELNSQDTLELFSLREASKKGISPAVHYISPNHKGVLMEFINNPTITLEQAKATENILKIADVIREAHRMSGHPSIGESLLSKALRCHEKVLNDGLGPKEEINHALLIINLVEEQLNNISCTKVNVHGDLNPRNIFLKDGKILLIDWAETTLEDPFYDLAYFSMKLDYSPEEEHQLLSSYLMRKSTPEELRRFHLHKKRHLAFWSLTNLYLADVELRKHPYTKVNKNTPLQSCSYYQKMNADGTEELTAQYFYELSRLNYKLATAQSS